MQKIFLLGCAILAIQTCRACNDDNEDQLATVKQLDEYFSTDAYGLIPDGWNALHYRGNPRFPDKNLNLTKKVFDCNYLWAFVDQRSPYEGRTPSSSWKSRTNPFSKYFLNGKFRLVYFSHAVSGSLFASSLIRQSA